MNFEMSRKAAGLVRPAAIGVLKGESEVARPLLGVGLLNLLDVRSEVEGGHCVSKTRAKEC